MKKSKRYKVKRVIGKPKIVNTNKVKNVYSAEGTDCKQKECKGVLKRMQWNRLLCTKCHYSELI